MPARRIHIGGVVQGVGFRPCVWQVARQLALTGWVRNSSSGVDIHLEGPAAALDDFGPALRAALPPLASIDTLTEAAAEPEGADRFLIVASRAEVGAYLPCGQYFQPTAYRRDLEGMLTGLPLFWNLRRSA